jgi:2-oxoglutarate/2-oxoacid ferredoxin oxidoreductase subunit alpha
MSEKELISAVVKFAGDSGDGMQVSGSLFSHATVLAGNDIATFPDFPAEIRAPVGTVSGISGFQLRFGSERVHSPGDQADMLVAMNAAALKSNLNALKDGGIVLANLSGMDSKNLRLAGYANNANPLEDTKLAGYHVVEVDFLKIAKEVLKDSGLGKADIDKGKNMVALGLVGWVYQRELSQMLQLVQQKFSSKGHWAEWNQELVKAGWAYGETAEVFHDRYKIRKAVLDKGRYRSIAGNEALSLGLMAAAEKAGLKLFLGAYPITPASDILHELSKYKGNGVITYQAEDEIAAVCAAIGASYGGNLGVTSTSGPGMSLKTEAIGLAVMLEIPLVICNIQRGGPSTGLPTKTEQADLLQALYGRNGEAPLIVLAAQTPKDCFMMAFEAAKLSLEHMTPVILLSDGYIANGAEPWKYPSMADLPSIKPNFATEPTEQYKPYARDEKLARWMAVPGTSGMQHRVGGLEKNQPHGNVSYEPDNHQEMVETRLAKVEKVTDYIPKIEVLRGKPQGKILVLGWGSTYGAISTAIENAHKAGIEVSQAHLKYLNPFPSNLGKLLSQFEHILVPELNMGQLSLILKGKFEGNFVAMNKVKGRPFYSKEILEKIIELNG